MADAVEVLERLGGIAGHARLLRHTTRAALRADLGAGRLQRVARGVYALPGRRDDLVAAGRIGGVLSHLSAARYWGWPVWRTPMRPQVTVRAHRYLPPARRRGCQVFRQEVAVDGPATSPVQTVLDCARRLPLTESLAVADAALAAGVSRDELEAAALELPRGRARTLRVAALADARADNPFESAVRALAHETGLGLQAQLVVPGYGRVDLGDPERRLLVECDSLRFHASRAALLNDIERYNRSALLGWTLLRFGWEHARGEDYVRQILRDFATRDGGSGRRAS